MNVLFRTSLTLVASIAISLGLFGSGPVVAGDVTCSDITWKPEVIKRFPDVITGCREVVVQGDQLFARFEAKLVRARITTGEVRIKIRLPDGGEVERTFKAPPHFMVNTSNGNRFHIFDLERGDIMDILISDQSFALASVDEKGSITLAPHVM